LLPYILFEKYIYILALGMACTGNRHCANCIGTLSFPVAAITRICCYILAVKVISTVFAGFSVSFIDIFNLIPASTLTVVRQSAAEDTRFEKIEFADLDVDF